MNINNAIIDITKEYFYPKNLQVSLFFDDIGRSVQGHNITVNIKFSHLPVNHLSGDKTEFT